MIDLSDWFEKKDCNPSFFFNHKTKYHTDNRVRKLMMFSNHYINPYIEHTDKHHARYTTEHIQAYL